MDKRAMVLEHLEQADRQVAEGKQIILKQEKILADLIRNGSDTTEALSS